MCKIWCLKAWISNFDLFALTIYFKNSVYLHQFLINNFGTPCTWQPYLLRKRNKAFITVFSVRMITIYVIKGVAFVTSYNVGSFHMLLCISFMFSNVCGSAVCCVPKCEKDGKLREYSQVFNNHKMTIQGGVIAILHYCVSSIKLKKKLSNLIS